MNSFENASSRNLSEVLRNLRSLEGKYNSFFLRLGSLVQEMYGTMLSMVSRVLEMERLPAFSGELRYSRIPQETEALRREIEDLAELLQFPDLADQRRSHIVQGLECETLPLLRELQRVQLHHLLEETQEFRGKCVSGGEKIRSGASRIRACLEGRHRKERFRIPPADSEYVPLEEILFPLKEEALKMGSLGEFFRDETAFLEDLEEEYRNLLGLLGKLSEKPFLREKGAEAALREKELGEAFRRYSTQEERRIFRRFFASREGLPPEWEEETSSPQENASFPENLPGVELF